jgi:hypothetical protein
VSIADNVEGWQTSLNGALRSLEDGVKLVTNVILAIKRRYLETDVEDEEIFNGRILDLAEDCDDARKAIQQVLFQDVTGPLREVITMFISFADLSSMIPRAEQGQQSENPQTAYELRERLRQAGKYLGGVVRNFDRMIEDIIRDFYRANLANPLVQGGKLGLYRVKALGFTSFENRFVRAQSLMNLLSIILQSEDLKAMSEIRWIWEEIIKGHDIDPDQVIKTPETMEAEARGKQEELAALQASEASAQAGGMPPDPNANLLAAKLQAEIEKLLAESNLRRTEADIRARQATNEQAQALAGLRAQTSQPTPAAAK